VLERRRATDGALVDSIVVLQRGMGCNFFFSVVLSVFLPN
jgi:hypothetical protein